MTRGNQRMTKPVPMTKHPRLRLLHERSDLRPKPWPH
jgi:hypothetical protein